MQIEVEHRFTARAGVLVDVFTDPAYIARLDELPKVAEPVLLDQHRSDEEVHQRVRYRFAGALPGAVTAVVDPARLAWVEETTYDRVRHTGRFRIVPEHYGDRLRGGGTIELVDDGAGGTRRRVAAELSVRYPVLGRRVERAIASGLAEHLADEVALVHDFLRTRGAGSGAPEPEGP